MKENRWQQIKTILKIALEKDTSSMEKYLDKVCANDAELRTEVASFIELREPARNFLQDKAIDLVNNPLIKDITSEEANIPNNTKVKPTDADNNIGRTLGDFLVKEKLGEGGFGAVYKAHQLTLDREAVIKILHTRHRTNADVIERFKREAHLASRLEHPYCAHIYSFGAESDGLLWIAMEMVAGTPLNEILKTQGALPLEKAVSLLDKICEVVHTAHEAGIIHRDLKPANVMVISRAGRLLPKLLDFGIAKGLSQNSITHSKLAPVNDVNKSFLDLISLNAKNNIDQVTIIDVNKSQATIIDNGNKETAITNTNIAKYTIIDNIPNHIPNSIKTSNSTNKRTSNYETTNEISNIEQDNKIAENIGCLDCIDNSPPYVLKTQGVIGSPAYMSPEQWNNGANIDARSDIYSLGILTYQMITGEHPFKESGYELYKAHTTKLAPQLKAGFPPLLNNVIQKVLAKKPKDRYQTALEFAKDFREAAGFTEQQITLPQLDEILKEDILTNAPKPIADTVASLVVARNAYQFRDRVLLVFHVLVHYLGILTLASHASIANKQKENELVNKTITSLRQQGLSDTEWVNLSRKLCRPFTKKRDAFPIPELITLFFSPNSQFLSHENETFARLLQLQEKIHSSVSLKEDELIEVLADFLSKLTTLLKTTSWLSNYYLVLPKGQLASQWMGIGKEPSIVPLRTNNVAVNKAILVDENGFFVLSLWPLIEIVEPTEGRSKEVFLLESKGRSGAKLVSFPYGFEIETEAPWQWLKEHFFTDEAKYQTESLEKSPYLGLTTFSPTDSALFFGREKETESFLNRLRITPLLAVVGPSGAGKSSFIQAGVVAGLAKNWKVLTVRPGLSPLTTLSTSLLKFDIKLENLKNDLEKDIDTLGKALRQYAITSNNAVLLVIDQFEEIFTLCPDKEEQKLYVEAIVSAARSEEDPIRVVLTMRDDFLVRAKELNALKHRLTQGLEILTTPASEELLKILILPARRAGYEFEDKELPMEIVDSLTGQTSALPLLAFTAVKLWEQRDKQFKQLRRRSYESMGGVAGALAKHAEEMLEKMSQAEQALVREAFRHLVTSEGTRAILTRLELLQLLGKNTEAETVLEKLISTRLLVTNEGEKGVDRIEIVHEALLTAWPRLVKWRQETAEGARLRDQLRAAARQWHERNRPKGLLWRDEALAELKLWHLRYNEKLTENELAFSKASFAEAARSQNRKRLLYSAAFVIMLIALATVFWINRETQNQLLQSYLDQGRNELLNGRPMQAAVYLSEVYKQDKNNTALKLLLGQAMRSVEVVQIASFDGSSDGIIEAHFSPDGKHVVTIGESKIKVWDIATTKTLSVITNSDSLRNVEFSHDGKLIATADYGCNVKIWNASNGQLLHTIEACGPIQFSPDDKQIATSSKENTIKLWDLASDKVLINIENFINLTSIKFSQDGTHILGSGDKTARLWDVVSGKTLLSIEGHSGYIYSSVFSPDGTKIVTASADRTAKIWDATNGKLLASLEGHNSHVTKVDFSADGKLIATSSLDKTIKIWNAANGRMLSSLAPHIGYVWSVGFNKDATQVVTASYDSTAKVLDISGLRVTDDEITHFSTASVAEYSKDGKFMLTGGSGNQISLFDNTGKNLLNTIKLSNNNAANIITASLSSDGKRIVTANFYDPPNTTAKLDNTAKVFNAETGKQLLTLTGHEANIVTVAFSKDGTRILTASYDKTAKVWNAFTGALLLTLVDNNGFIRSAEFSPNGRQIVTAGEDNSAKLWDANNGKLLRLLTGHSMELIYATFSPDGLRVVTTSTDATAKVMDAVTGELLLSLDGHSGDVRYCSFSPDGSLIATASGDGTAKVWDATNGKMLLSLESNAPWVNMVNFSPDQHHLITASINGAIRVWELPQETRTPTEIAKIVEQYVPFQFKQGQLIPITRKSITK